jgi:hypothetical protein
MILISACSNNAQNDSFKIQILNSGIEASNSLIRDQTFALYKLLDKKLNDQETKERVTIWVPKALMIKKYSDSMRAFIDSLKNDLANSNNDEGLESETNDKVPLLYNKLTNYKRDILSVDPELFEIFKNKIVAITIDFDSSSHSERDFAKSFFDGASKKMSLGILDKFENNINIAEFKTVTFCNYKSDMIIETMTSFSTLIGQTTTHAKPGEFIEITAGVGEFCGRCNPKININGVSIPVTNGAAEYKFKAANKPGKYSVPVVINFVDESGREMYKKQNVTYIVDE